MTEQRYSREEVDAILRRAVERERSTDDLSREQLMAIAQEIGVAPESMERAITEVTVERREHEELARIRAEMRRGFVSHLIPYLCVNGLLVILNVLTTSFPWVLFPLFGWGIGLLSHLLAVVSPSRERLQRQLERRRARQSRRDRKRQLKAGAKEIELVVGEGVAALLQAATARVSQGVESIQKDAARQVRIGDDGSDVNAGRSGGREDSGATDDPGARRKDRRGL
jgi:hypothetical protein